MRKLTRALACGLLSMGMMAGTSFAEDLHKVHAPDGSASVDVPRDWRCSGGHQGMMCVEGPNGDGAFGYAGEFVTESSLRPWGGAAALGMNPDFVADYCSPEDFIRSIFPRFFASADQEMTGVRVVAAEDLMWPESDAKMLGFTCVKDGVRMSYFGVVATFPTGDDRWTVYFTLLGVRTEELESSWGWMTSTFASFQVSGGESRRRVREIARSMDRIAEIRREVAEDRQAAQDRSNKVWDDYIRGQERYVDTKTGHEGTGQYGTTQMMNEAEGYARYRIYTVQR